ncbi:hypothetical protein KCP71_04015 [Salmonella enterica subsp. enterica]|nr:hypothetical protein KCP71_04015 [Salmonella enterica subsp. enterica]
MPGNGQKKKTATLYYALKYPRYCRYFCRDNLSAFLKPGRGMEPPAAACSIPGVSPTRSRLERPSIRVIY